MFEIGHFPLKVLYPQKNMKEMCFSQMVPHDKYLPEKLFFKICTYVFSTILSLCPD